jgi:hypothetical protein
MPGELANGRGSRSSKWGCWTSSQTGAPGWNIRHTSAERESSLLSIYSTSTVSCARAPPSIGLLSLPPPLPYIITPTSLLGAPSSSVSLFLSIHFVLVLYISSSLYFWVCFRSFSHSFVEFCRSCCNLNFLLAILSLLLNYRGSAVVFLLWLLSRFPICCLIHNEARQKVEGAKKMESIYKRENK